MNLIQKDVEMPLNPQNEQPLVFDYEKAITNTIDFRRPFTGKLFQIMIIMVVILSANSGCFLIIGLPFMKIEP